MAKYPRTLHLPWSPGGTNDDKRLTDVNHFLGKQLVLTEKIDGSNVCLERSAVFARSHSGAPKHPSFDALKQLHSTVRHLIPDDGTQLFGEWCYARHSIAYTALPSYFLLFGIRIGTRWDDWHSVVLKADAMGLQTVPVLHVFTPYREEHLRSFVEGCTAKSSACGGEREGVVLRVFNEFDDQDFPSSLAKWVRKDHVTTDDHWASQAIVRNGLAAT